MNYKDIPKRRYGICSTDMLGMPQKRCLLAAEKLLNGRLVVSALIRDEMPYCLDDFDWNISFSESPTTFQLFLHALGPVSYLTGAFVLSHVQEAFVLAKRFIESWENSVDQKILIQQGNYSWDQHATALRTEALLYFLLVGQENALLNEQEQMHLSALLERHGAYLENDRYYLPHENHGVFEDRALLYLGYAFNRDDWVHLAIRRAEEQWNFLFTAQGVCIENSYTYQRVNKGLFLEIAKVLKAQHSHFGYALQEGVLLAEEFMGFALMPDGTSPPYGDSQRDDYTMIQPEDPHGVLAYACARPEAVCPVQRSVVYPDAGYFIGREFWDPPHKGLKRADAFWTMLRSGYRSITHRHADDNSFQLYARGHSVFIDSGAYNYMFRDPRRIYVRSSHAHNTVIVDNQSYDFLRLDCSGLSGFVSCSLRDDKLPCDYITAFSRHYCGVTHIRHFFYFDTDVVLVDELRSRNRHCYSQLFHCGKDIHFSQANRMDTRVRIGNSGYAMQILQHLPCDELQIYHGMKQGVLYGNCSEQFNELLPVDTLKYDLNGSDVFFVTQLSLLDPCGHSASGLTFQADLAARYLTIFNPNGTRAVCPLEACQIQPGVSFRFPMDMVSIHQSGNCVTFVNEAAYRDPVKYSWYLLAPDGRTLLRQVPYRAEPSFCVDAVTDHLEENVLYSVKAFVYCRKQRQKAEQTVATLQLQNGMLTVRPLLAYDKNLTSWMEE